MLVSLMKVGRRFQGLASEEVREIIRPLEILGSSSNGERNSRDGLSRGTKRTSQVNDGSSGLVVHEAVDVNLNRRILSTQPSTSLICLCEKGFLSEFPDGVLDVLLNQRLETSIVRFREACYTMLETPTRLPGVTELDDFSPPLSLVELLDRPNPPGDGTLSVVLGNSFGNSLAAVVSENDDMGDTQFLDSISDCSVSAGVLLGVLVRDIILGDDRSYRSLENGRRRQSVIRATQEHERRGLVDRTSDIRPSLSRTPKPLVPFIKNIEGVGPARRRVCRSRRLRRVYEGQCK